MATTDFDTQAQLRTLMAYAADLELEVDRLRRRDHFIQLAISDHVDQTSQLCSLNMAPYGLDDALSNIQEKCGQLTALLHDVYDPPECQLVCDEVVDIALRPFVEKAFRWQQRISGKPHAVLRLELQSERLQWFPMRLRHILDNVISNALKYSDPSAGEIRVGLAVNECSQGYELRVTDNGIGMPDDQSAQMLEIFYRAFPVRDTGLGVGLAVVKFLVEQVCGTVSVQSGLGQGTSVRILLPHYGLGDHVDDGLSGLTT